MQAIPVTHYDAVTDTSTAKSAEWPWDVLVSALTQHTQRPDKDGPGWSPALFASVCSCGRSSCPGASGHRIDQNAREIGALVLDVDKRPDGSPLTEGEALSTLAAIRNQGLRFVCHTTHSHAPPAKQSWRVVIALSRTVPATEWPKFWELAVGSLGIHAEPSCRNPGRFWYLPSTPEPNTAESQSFEGEPLDVDSVLALQAPAQVNQAESRPTAYDDGDSVFIEGNRNNALMSLGGRLRKAGLGEDAIAAALMLENQRRVRPPLEASEVLRIASSVSRYDPEQDWGTAAVFAEHFLPREEFAGALTLEDVLARGRPPVRSYPTGIATLDRLLGGGVSTRQLAVICAPPGSGKTGFAMGLALRLESHLPILVASTELESEENVARAAAPTLGRAWRDIVRGYVPTEEVRAAVAGKRIYTMGCDDLSLDGNKSVERILQQAEAIKKNTGQSPILIIDYLQDLARGDQDLRVKMGGLATLFRVASQSLDCPVVCVSSVSRAYYGLARAETMRAVDDASIYLAAAKESGDVDFAAAAVLFLDVDRESGMARVAVAKSRHGETGFCGMKFHGATGEWEEKPEALHFLSPEGADDRRKTEGSDRRRKDALSIVERVNSRGEHLTRTKLKELMPGDNAKSLAAINDLIVEGALTTRKVQVPIGDGRTRTVDVLVIPKPESPKVLKFDEDSIAGAWVKDD